MDEAINSAERGNPVYVYKPSLLGAPWEFRLAPDAIEWRMGRHHGRTPYGRIARVRLSYRPVTMQMRRFLTEIWAADGPRLSIASASWKSIVEQETKDQAYGAFVRELHRRIAATGARPALVTGSPAFLYWPGLAIFVVVSLGLAALTLQGLRAGAWAGAAFVGGFLALFLWQSGNYFHRNRPGSYRPDALPAELVPPA
jgi:hypothetical protein